MTFSLTLRSIPPTADTPLSRAILSAFGRNPRLEAVIVSCRHPWECGWSIFPGIPAPSVGGFFAWAYVQPDAEPGVDQVVLIPCLPPLLEQPESSVGLFGEGLLDLNDRPWEESPRGTGPRADHQ